VLGEDSNECSLCPTNLAPSFRNALLAGECLCVDGYYDDTTG